MSEPNVIDILPTDSFASAAGKITLKPDAIIFLFGSFDASLTPNIRSLFARALAPVALTANALLIDNGSSDSLASQVGEAVHQMDQTPALLGVLATDTVTPEPNHANLLRLPAPWSEDLIKSTFLLIAEFVKDAAAVEKPVVAVLLGGTDADKITVQRCARRNWPVFVVQGAGGLGDEILAELEPPADGSVAPPITDPDLREIVDTASLLPLPLDGNVDDLKRMLLSPIQPPGDVLLAAWSRYDDLDKAAIDKQTRFRHTQMAILSLGVVSTLLAVLISGNAFHSPVRAWLHSWLPQSVAQNIQGVLHSLLILVPITTSVLVSFNSRFREGNKWILLRAAAESLKREIFRYRTRSGDYSADHCGLSSAQSKLAANIKNITANLAQTEVNRSNIPHHPKDNPLRAKFLRPDDYLVQRIQDQTCYFIGKTAGLYKRLKRIQFLALVIGGMGTFLAAIHFEVWVAFSTALVTAFATKLELDQVENSLVQYNIALTNLKNIECWWRALSPWEMKRARNIDLLVDQTEKTLQLETTGWVQQMQSELDKLTEKQPIPKQGSSATP